MTHSDVSPAIPVARSIAIVTPHFTPEANAASHRLTALASGLVEDGWSVTVLTLAPNHPENRIHEGFGKTARAETQEAGATVIRFRPWLTPRNRLALRLTAEGLFSLRVLFALLRKRHDVVLATSPHMFLGPISLLAARLARSRFAWDVRDLTWQYLAATGRRTFGMDRVLDFVMQATAARADLLTTATHGQLEYFKRRPRHAETIVNGLTPERLTELARLPEPSETGDAGPTVTYAGLIGFPQGLDVTLGAAERLPHVDFVLAGDGPDRERLLAETRRRGLENVQFPGHVDFTSLLELFRASTILFAHLRRHPAFTLAQPSKLWEYMATGRPVVYAGEGEAAEIIERNGIGVVCRPDDPDELAAAIKGLADDPARCIQLGRAARSYVKRERDRDGLTRRWQTQLDELAR